MRYVIIIFAWLSLSACATVNNSSVDYFRIDSVPQGAKVVTTVETPESKKLNKGLNHVPQYYGCEPTPCAIPFPRRSKFIATVTHPGYEPAEILISSSSSKGSFAGTMAATTATVAGTAVASAATTAALVTLQTQIISVIGTGILNTYTFGAVPISATAIPATTTSSLLASAAPPALAITGSMLLVDAASGANKNLYPNPVVLGLAPKGEESKIDPLAVLYREELALKRKSEELCQTGRARDKERANACKESKSALAASRKKQKDVMDLFREAQRELAKSAKAETKATRAASEANPN